MKDKYNPFKMWGPYVGIIVIWILMISLPGLENGSLPERDGICPWVEKDRQLTLPIPGRPMISLCQNAFNIGTLTTESVPVYGSVCVDDVMYYTNDKCISRILYYPLGGPGALGDWMFIGLLIYALYGGIIGFVIGAVISLIVGKLKTK